MDSFVFLHSGHGSIWGLVRSFRSTNGVVSDFFIQHGTAAAPAEFFSKSAFPVLRLSSPRLMPILDLSFEDPRSLLPPTTTYFPFFVYFCFFGGVLFGSCFVLGYLVLFSGFFRFLGVTLGLLGVSGGFLGYLGVFLGFLGILVFWRGFLKVSQRFLGFFQFYSSGGEDQQRYRKE